MMVGISGLYYLAPRNALERDQLERLERLRFRHGMGRAAALLLIEKDLIGRGWNTLAAERQRETFEVRYADALWLLFHNVPEPLAVESARAA